MTTVLELTADEQAMILAKREKAKQPDNKKIFGWFRVLEGQHIDFDPKDPSSIEGKLYSKSSSPFPSYSDLVTRFGDDKFVLVKVGAEPPNGSEAMVSTQPTLAIQTALNPKEDTFDAMTIDELKNWANGESINLGKAKTKPEILAVIREATANA